MRIRPLLLLCLVSLIFSGCISISYHQKFESDGSSVVTQITDASALTKLANSSSLFPDLLNGSSNKKPENTKYDPSVYSAYPAPESYGITLMIQQQGEINAGGSYPNIQFAISNNGNLTIRDAQLTIDSNAFSSSSRLGNFLGTIKPDEHQTSSLYLTLLDVAPGIHPLTAVLSFKDEEGSQIKVAKTEMIEIKEKATPTPSTTPNYAQSFEKQCDEVRNTGGECTYADGKVTATKRYPPENKFSTFKSTAGFPNIKYEVEVFALPATNTTSSSGTGLQDYDLYKRLDDPALQKTVSFLKMAGMAITYKVEMPGKIVKADGGAISGSVAEFNAISMMESGKTIKVVSEELNVPYVVGAGVLVLVLLILILKFALKKPPASPEPFQVAQNSGQGSFPPAA